MKKRKMNWTKITKEYHTSPNASWRVAVSIGRTNASNDLLLLISKERCMFGNGNWVSVENSQVYLSEKYWKELFISNGIISQAISELRNKRKEGGRSF